MLKKYKWSLLFSSLLLLLPPVAGLLLDDRLSENASARWGLAVGLPLLLLISQWFCVLLVWKDPKNRGQDPRVLRLAIWSLPTVSVGIQAMVWYAPEDPMGAERLMIAAMGLLFAVFGLLFPFCRPNHTIGVRLPWTLQSEENWKATHAFSGRVWLIGGILILLSAALPWKLTAAVSLLGLMALLVLPIAYSCRFAKKHPQTVPQAVSDREKKSTRFAAWLTAALLVVTAVLVGVMMASGDITLCYGTEALTIDANVWSDLTLAYEDIYTVEYRQTDEPGVRTFGFGNARLLAGSFRNEEFGDYTRYSYPSCAACVVLTTADGVVVLNGTDGESTERIYETLRARGAAVEKN